MADWSMDVIVTHRNFNEFLDAAVRSALDQDGVRTSVIIVDDASDNPPDFGDWPVDRVHLIRRDAHGGQGAAINTGLAASAADVVAFLDADDLFPAHRGRVLMEALTAADADLVYGAQVVFNDGDVPQLKLPETQRQMLPEVTAGLLTGTVVVTRDAVRRLGPLAEEGMLAPFMQWMALARRLEPPLKQVALNEVVLLRRSHANNTSRRQRDEVTAAYFDLIAHHRAQLRPPGS